MKRAAHGAKEEDDIDVPHLHHTQPEQDHQDGRGPGHSAVGQNHRPAPAPTIDQRADEGAENRLWHDADDRGDGQHGGRAGLLRQPPDERELHQLAAQQRKHLTNPQRQEWAQ